MPAVDEAAIAAAVEVFRRPDFGTHPTAGTVPQHNGHLFVCTDQPFASWPAAVEHSTELLPRELQDAVAEANGLSGTSPAAAAADWRFKLTLCETPSHATPHDILAFPHYARFGLGPKRWPKPTR